MIKIAVVGAGNLGSRHLQALSLLDREAQIYVIDPSDRSLEVARSRFLETYNPDSAITVSYAKEIESLPEAVDVVINATSSDVRRKVIEKLLTGRRVKHLILEKVLFQEIEDYSAVGNLIEEKQVHTWVNCTRRAFPGYQWLRGELKGVRFLGLEVLGSQWGLASNCIHMLDLFSFLTGQADYLFNAVELDRDVVPSKRAGFCELTGTVRGTMGDSTSFSIASFQQGTLPLMVRIAADSIAVIIRETEGKAFIARGSDGWRWEDAPFQILYQSQVTHSIVKDLVDNGKCELPSYELSEKLHVPLIEMYLGHFRRILNNPTLNSCPIT